MSHYLIARVRSLGVLAAPLAAAMLFTSTAAYAQEGSSGCDRACLRQALDAYLAAVFKHDPKAAKLTDDHYATENTAVVRNGEGFWKEISGYGALQRRYFDPVNGAAAFLGLLKQNGTDLVSSVRIKVEGGKVVSGGGLSSNLQRSVRLRLREIRRWMPLNSRCGTKPRTWCSTRRRKAASRNPSAARGFT